MSLFKIKKSIISQSYDISSKDFIALPSRIYDKEDKQASLQEFRLDNILIKDILSIYASIFIAAIGYGILAVMIAFKAEQYIKNEILISLSSATQISSGIIFARFLPILGRKIGLTNSIYLGTAMSSISSLLIYSYSGYFLWLLTVFIIGASSFICGVVRQTMTIDLAPSHIRASVISCGGMLFSIGNSLGPIFLQLVKTFDGFTTHLMIFGFLLTSMLPLSRITKIEAKVREEKKIGIWRYIKNSPKIMFASFAVNYALSSCSTFIIIYGMKIGMDQGSASLLLSVLLFGAVFSIPIGYLTDLINRRFLMISCATLSVICALLLFQNEDPQKIYILIFLMFGCMVGIKLPAIILINEKYKPTQRLAVNSSFGKMALLGNLFGIFLTGSIMKYYGPKGLWLSIILILSSFLIFCCLNYINKAIKSDLDFSKFYFFNKNKTYDEQLP